MEPRRIPLFPLNVVLFPGMPLPLHIFELRYQQMVRACLEADRRFGVCLIREGEEVGGPAEPHEVGTLCEILTVTELGAGRMVLTTVGRERFRVTRLIRDRAYLEAVVEPFADREPGPLGPLPERVRDAALRYVRAALALRGAAAPEVELPAEPTALSFTAGALLQVPLPIRQELLEEAVLVRRLRRELQLLEQEAARLEAARRAPARKFVVNRDDLSMN